MKYRLFAALVTCLVTPALGWGQGEFPIKRVIPTNISVTSAVGTHYGNDADSASGLNDVTAHAYKSGVGPLGWELATATSRGFIFPQRNQTSLVPEITTSVATYAEVFGESPGNDARATASGTASPSTASFTVMPKPGGETPGDNTLYGFVYVSNEVDASQKYILRGKFSFNGFNGTYVKCERKWVAGVLGWELRWGLSKTTAANPTANFETGSEFQPGDLFGKLFQFSMRVPEIQQPTGYRIYSSGIQNHEAGISVFLEPNALTAGGNHNISAINWFYVQDN